MAVLTCEDMPPRRAGSAGGDDAAGAAGSGGVVAGLTADGRTAAGAATGGAATGGGVSTGARLRDAGRVAGHPAPDAGGAGETLPLIVIVGPTAVGKTELSLLVAERLPVEIISGDSTQVYRGLDIGTDKVPAEVRRRIPHHLIDIRDPDEPYSVADFQRDATEAIAAIRRRGRYPLLVGGTGFYVTALLYGYSFQEMPPDPGLRERLQREYDTLGAEVMHRRLAAIDPASAERIHPRDRKRLVRALEIWHQTGRPPSQYRERKPRPRFGARCFGLTDERANVYRAIEERVDRQLARGLVEEVWRLLDAGYSPDLPAMQALGYKEIVGYLRGEYDLVEARRLLVRNTRRYAKRQWTWFRHQMEVRWFHRGHWTLPAIADRIVAEVRGAEVLGGDQTGEEGEAGENIDGAGGGRR